MWVSRVVMASPYSRISRVRKLPMPDTKRHRFRVCPFWICGHSFQHHLVLLVFGNIQVLSRRNTCKHRACTVPARCWPLLFLNRSVFLSLVSSTHSFLAAWSGVVMASSPLCRRGKQFRFPAKHLCCLLDVLGAVVAGADHAHGLLFALTSIWSAGPASEQNPAARFGFGSARGEEFGLLHELTYPRNFAP